MPKGPKKTTTTKPPFYIALLLVKIFLIKIGNFPFWITKLLGIFAKGGYLRMQRALRTCFARPCDLLNLIAKVLDHAPIMVHGVSEAISRRTLTLSSKRAGLPTGATKRTRGRPKKFRLSKRSKIVIAVSSFLIFLFVYSVFLLTAAYQLPTPSRLISPNEPLTTEFYDRNGSLLYRLYTDKNRTLVQLSEVPKDLIQATIATEDQNFYQHMGIDPIAITRAFFRNLTNRNLEGASTITQQLIKNSLLTPEKSYLRKIKEIILALWVERIYSKDQILQMYFNETPYGGTNIGIAAAAQTYFGKLPRNLTLAQSAYLAGLPVSPTEFSPYGARADLAKLRQKEVLSRMVKVRYITQKQADSAFAEDLNIQPPVNNILAPHFVMYVRDILSEKYGSRIVSQGGLKVYTTLDLNLQEKVEKIVKDEINNLAPLNVKNGAAMVTDTNGQILAMVGSKDYHEPKFGNFNVTTSLRQPGSSIKVITYAAAFKKGFSPGNTVLDIPVAFPDNAGTYAPVNYDGKFHGPVSIRTALGSSYNIPAVKLLATVGMGEAIKTAQDLGITTFTEPQRYGLSLTLGGAEVKMIDMMSVYGSFANLGVKKYPTPFIKVTDSNGNLLEELKDTGEKVLEPQIAYFINDILKDNKARTPAFGPNSLLNIPGFEVAVKTGTSDNKKDNWTFGYTPKFVVGVWVGNPDNSPMNPALSSGITGAAPIWNKIVHTLLDNTTPLAFQKPTGIIEAVIDGRKDLSLSGAVPKSLVRTQKQEDKFIFSDPFSSYATPAAQPNQQADQVNPAQPTL